MSAIVVLLIGVVIVIGSVLFLRLHAFLALVLAALVVALLTPHAAIERFWVQKKQLKFALGPGEANGTLSLITQQKPEMGERFVILQPTDDGLKRLTVVAVVDTKEETQAGCLVRAKPVRAVDASLIKDVTAAHLLVRPHDWKVAQKAAQSTIGERVALAFGNTCGKIGILIALAAIIGKCLLDSGAADRIVRSALRLLGEKGAPGAFIGSGFLLGIPVFFDTVFYLMMPLGKALRMRTGRNYLLYVLTIVAGASMAHSLVPPTPGPLLVAGELGVDLGVMILGGCIVGLFTSSSALLYAQFVNRRAEVPLRESSDFSLAEIEALTQRDESELPSLWISLAPIVLPVILIAGNTVVKSFDLLPDDSPLLSVAATLGNKNIALALATAIALGTLVRFRGTKLQELGDSIQGALASGGVIILITAGGGAFGGILQQTGVANLISAPQGSSLLVIALAFLITTAIRSAQGSATVAMITAVGILSGFVDQLACHPVYLALAIGCGSKPIAWMNDSGFWVICKMSGMTEAEGLRFVTPMSILMGLIGLLVTLLGAWLVPLT